MTTATPLVSGVICAYNGERFLRETVESALGQTCAGMEVVVVDDGSTDGTAAIIRSFGSRVRAVRQDNGGIASARNLGLTTARGKWVALLDHDDLWEPEKTQKQIDALTARPGAVMSYSHAHLLRGDKKTGEILGDPPDPGRSVFESLVIRNRVPALTALFDRDLAISIGGFTAGTVPSDDRDLWIRLSRQGDVVFVSEPLGVHRYHEASFGASDWRRSLGAARFVVEQYVPEVSPAVARAARLQLASIEGPLCARDRDWRGAARASAAALRYGGLSWSGLGAAGRTVVAALRLPD